ncbi:MAG: S-layer homology domain-containing protein, partial [Candidatus Gracilibacteria bacterium]|nr:S-layer homology domain-containing protein [Candidatus Gracilibacteria bacterium]
SLADESAVECMGDVFTDVSASNGDLCGYIEAAAALEIVSSANAKFRPLDLVTRAEMVKMLLSARGVAPTDVSAGFEDVPVYMGDLYGYINAAVAEGLIKSGVSFRPNATATRGEAFKVASGAYALDSDGTVEPPVDTGTGTTTPPTTGTGTTGTGVTVGTPGTTVSTGDVMVSMNPATPAATTLATGSAYNKVLVVDIKAGSSDATVTGVEVTRTGLLSNTNVAGVSAWVGGSRIGNVAQSLTSDGKATITFGTTPLQINAGETKTVTIALNVRAGVYSGTVGLTLSKVLAGGTVTGAPVSSAVHSVVDGSSALVQYNVTSIAVGGGSSEPSAVSLDIGQTTEVAKFKVEQTNSKEDLVVEGINVFVEGSVSDGDLDTFQIVSQEGNVLASATTSVGRYVNFQFTAPYTIPQGSSRFFTVKATVATGKYNSSRTFSAKIRDDFDIVAKGAVTGTYVLASSIPTTTQYWYKVREGTVTVAKATDSRSQSAAPGIDDVVLATFDVKASGEDLEFQKLNFKVTKATSSGANLRGTLKLTVDGQTVFSTDAANTTNYDTTGANPGYLSTYFTIKAGATAKVAIVGSIATSATNTDNYVASLMDASYKLISSNSIKTLSLTGTNGNTIAVENVSLTASANGGFSTTNLVKGQSNAKIGSFNLQASNADDLNITTVGVALSGGVTGINNLTLKVGVNSIATSVANPQSTGNTFSINAGALKVVANSTVMVDVYADVTSAATGSGIQAILEANRTSAVGVLTAVSVTGPASSATSAAVSIVSNGTLTVETDSLTPSKQILVAGMTNVEILRFKVRASNNEDVRLEKLTLGSGSTTGTGVTDLGRNLTNVKLFDGSTQIGTAQATFVDNVAQFTGLNYVVPKAGTKSISVRADTTASVTLEKGKEVVIKPTSVEYTGVAGGSLSTLAANTTAVTTANAVSATMLVQDSKVVLASTMATPSGKVVGSTNHDIAAYSIKAEGTRDVSVKTITVRLSGNAAASGSNFRLRYNNTDYATGSLVSGDVVFTLASPIVVTAGQTVSFMVRADTSSIVPPSNGTLTLGTSLEGVQGAANTSNAVSYEYTDVNGGTSGVINTSDSYTVAGAVLSF